MPRVLKETSQFKTDKKRIKGSGRYEWEKMRVVVKDLMNDRPLDKKHRDHELSGEYEGASECHVEPDWLLIYDKSGSIPDGHPNSPTCGHLKFPHPERGVTAG